DAAEWWQVPSNLSQHIFNFVKTADITSLQLYASAALTNKVKSVCVGFRNAAGAARQYEVFCAHLCEPFRHHKPHTRNAAGDEIARILADQALFSMDDTGRRRGGVIAQDQLSNMLALRHMAKRFWRGADRHDLRLDRSEDSVLHEANDFSETLACGCR